MKINTEKKHFVIFNLEPEFELGKKVADLLGVSLGKMENTTFSDGEQFIKLAESCRGKSVYLIQSTNQPDSNFVRLALAVDAARRAHAKEIIAVMPYFGYARQERKSEAGAPISTRVFTTFLETLGVNRIITFDLHAKAIEGFFLNTVVDQLYARDIFIEQLKKDFKKEIKNNEIVVVAPDTGAANNARNFASVLLVSPDLAIISKSRLAAGKIASMELIGSVAGKTAIIVDDMADTCGTIVKAAEVVKAAGAEKVVAVLTHAIFSNNAVQKLENSVLESVYITDTIMQKNLLSRKKIKSISVAKFLAKVIDKMEHDTHNVDNLFTS